MTDFRMSMTTTSKPALRVLQMGPLTDRFDANLSRQYRVIPLWQQPDPEDWLARHGGEVDLLVTSGRFGCSAEQLALLSGLRAICSSGVGHDSIDVAGATARGIPVSVTPGVLDACVADLAMGLILDVARGIAASDRFVRAGEWQQKKPVPLRTRVSGKRLGIVGLGRIGRTIVERASGFAMEVRYHNRKPSADSTLRYEASLPALAEWADFLVVTVVGGAGTHHLISAEVLAALGPEGFLINVSRGSVVDEAALIDALASKRLGGAALDVFEHEPAVPEALMQFDNVVLTSHIASATQETRLEMEALLLDNIASFVADGKLLTPVV